MNDSDSTGRRRVSRKGEPSGPRAPLAPYRAKRSAERTPEPFGGTPAAASARLFVVQKHRARRLHYDFRLELGGVLKSWAVPKGPSFDPAEKRLAVEVEDHPFEYADFEGTIPEGNYGAGAVIVWDRGTWRPLEDPEEGLRKGKLLFELEGAKLAGVWTLVRTKGRDKTGKEWLLIKKPDGAAGSPPPSEASVLSGLTVEELAAGRSPAEELEKELGRLGAVKRRARARDVSLMLAETAERPFTRTGWLFELKYDGYRLLVERHGDKVGLFYRRGADVTWIFPEVERAARALPYDSFVLDGELVVLDQEGRSSFQRLQSRVQLSRPADIARASLELPVTVYVFDCLAAQGYDLRELPLGERKRLLQRLLPAGRTLRFADHVEERGEDLFEEIRRRGLEGVVAKRERSTYRGGRSSDWLKIPLDRTGDFAIVGFTAPKGSRAAIGALHLGVATPQGFRYAGRVGSGFSDRQLGELRSLLEPHRIAAPAVLAAPRAGRGDVWVEPKFVCEVRYKQWTDEGSLRHPVFLRLRDDKTVEECTRDETLPEPPPPPPAAPVERVVPFSNTGKVFWPEEGYTKGDLIEYYRSVARWLLPYLRDRPIVLTRYPDGIAGKSFFQKDAPGFAPEWLRTVRLWSDQSERDLDYLVCDDEPSLLYVANLGSIPIHVWSSRVASLAQPDWCILDLDPKEAPFEDVVTIALAFRRLCESIGLPAFPKTSGQKGLHVLVPLGAQCTYEQSRQLGELLCRVVEAEHPDRATLTRNIAGRGGRVYLDYLQNGHGRTIASPYCVRPVPGAPVSTPLRWSEVTKRLDPRCFDLRSVPRRLERLGEDPMAPVLTLRPDLPRILGSLSSRLS